MLVMPISKKLIGIENGREFNMGEKKYDLNEELERQSKLISENPEVIDLAEKIDKYVSTEEKIQTGQWLNEDELKTLDLDSKAIADYLSAKEIIEAEELKSPDDISAEYLAKQNDQIEFHNQKVEEARLEKEAVKSVNELADRLNELSSLENNLLPFLKKFTSAHNNLILPNWLKGDYVESTIPIAPLGGFKKNYGKLVKNGILESNLTSKKIIEEVSLVLEVINDEINRLKEAARVKKEGMERLKRIQEDESMLGRIRKYLKGDKDKEEQ